MPSCVPNADCFRLRFLEDIYYVWRNKPWREVQRHVPWISSSLLTTTPPHDGLSNGATIVPLHEVFRSVYILRVRRS
eukprot:scaffold27080_cov234-Skeletonema_menzelii.AAC.5